MTTKDLMAALGLAAGVALCAMPVSAQENPARERGTDRSGPTQRDRAEKWNRAS